MILLVAGRRTPGLSSYFDIILRLLVLLIVLEEAIQGFANSEFTFQHLLTMRCLSGKAGLLVATDPNKFPFSSDWLSKQQPETIPSQCMYPPAAPHLGAYSNREPRKYLRTKNQNAHYNCRCALYIKVCEFE